MGISVLLKNASKAMIHSQIFLFSVLKLLNLQVFSVMYFFQHVTTLNSLSW